MKKSNFKILSKAEPDKSVKGRKKKHIKADASIIASYIDDLPASDENKAVKAVKLEKIDISGKVKQLKKEKPEKKVNKYQKKKERITKTVDIITDRLVNETQNGFLEPYKPASESKPAGATISKGISFKTSTSTGSVKLPISTKPEPTASELEYANNLQIDDDDAIEIDTMINDNIDSVDLKQRSNQYLITERVEMLIKDILKGLPTFELVKKYTNLWKINTRCYFIYQKKAITKLEKASETRITAELGKSIKRLENLYELAIDTFDIKNALAVQKEINELLGMKKPQKVETSTATIVKFVENDVDIYTPDETNE